jgi:hypothetical protein
VRHPLRRAVWIILAPAIFGCADRPLDLPWPVDAGADLATTSDLGNTSAGASDLAVTPDLASVFDLAGSDLVRSDLAVVSDLAWASDLAVAHDLSTRDLARPNDLASSDLACGCGRECASLCALGQPCRDDDDCLSNACDSVSSTCVADPCDDHHRDGRESDIDCGDGVCRPCPSFWHCTEDANCASPFYCKHAALFAWSYCTGGQCVTSYCSETASHCGDGVRDGDESDIDCGGQVCTACLVGQHCNSSFDCQAGHLCSGGICLGPNCSTCGFNCLLCGDGQPCSSAADCISGVCDSSSHACAAPTCSDQVKNGNETGVDCGGSCPPCALGVYCLADSDCQSQACDGLRNDCVADRCADHRLDGNESDVDCGGACATCPLGGDCNSDADCGPNRCDEARLLCVPPWCLDGKLDGNESDLDCGGPCTGCALGGNCRVDQDCASHACDALTLRCVADACADHWRDGAETSVDCGGACGACTVAEECQSDVDCGSGLSCDLATQECHDAWCSDGAQDHGESDVDCGVAACVQCGLGKKCNADSDCLSDACDASSGICISDHCQDHRTDGDETDLDCGGRTCPACAPGKACRWSFDCVAGHPCSPSYACE